MRKVGILLTIWTAVLGLLSGCGKEDSRDKPWNDGKPADLTFSVRIPVMTAGTKAGYADGAVSPADTTGWKRWELLVDGQSFYRLTLFLIRRHDNTLVAYRDFYLNGSSLNDYCADAGRENGFCSPDGTLLPADTQYAVAAIAHFNYLNPLHGASATSIEKLRSGEYRLLAVANYSSIGPVTSESGVRTYAGLQDNGTAFSSLVDGVISAFNNHLTDGLSNFTADNPAYAPLFKYDIRTVKADGTYSGSADELYVCEQRPQPLSLVKDFLVLSGTCNVNGELVRTYSRIRFTLNNESSSEDLTLNRFSFETPFSQRQTYLFDFGDDSRYTDFGNGIGIPVLDAPAAIHPYPGDGLTILTEDSRVIYDAYILESDRGSDSYQYKINLEYAGVNTTEITLTDGQPIRTEAGLKSAWLAGHYKYLIKGFNDRGFLYDGTLNENVAESNRRVYSENYNVQQGGVKTWLDKNILTAVNNNTRSTTLIADASTLALSCKDGSPITDLRLDGDYEPFIWTLERAGDNAYYILNEATGQYWDKRITTSSTANEFRLRTTMIGYSYYMPVNFTYNGATGIAFQNGVSSGALCYLHKDCYGNGTKNNRDAMWILYACDSGLPASAVKVIPLQVIDPVSNQPYNLESLSRNDFVKINIFASIQPDGGTLSFKVIPWIPKDAEIEFE